MTARMTLTLKDGERVFVNGAVLRAEGRVSFTLLNEASFLLESYVMQPEKATTPLRQLYFITQSLLMYPDSRSEMQDVFNNYVASLMGVSADPTVATRLRQVQHLVTRGRYFDALKELKKLFPLDAAAEAA